MTKAVVVEGPDSGLKVVDVVVDDPGPGEVRVKIAASGICGSDLHVLHGRSNAAVYPSLIGHEGAGTIESVGLGVELAVGTRVVVALGASCGRCARCAVGEAVHCEDPGRRNRLAGLMGDGSARVHQDGHVVHPFTGCGTLAELVVVPAHEVVPIPDEMPFDVAALAACGVTTGLGAVFNIAEVTPGQTVLVVGCGGVGLNVVQGSKLAGAGRIIAADTSPAKLELATQFGATDVVDSSDGLTDAVRALVPGGVDVAFEVVGFPDLVTEALLLTKAGGTCVCVGSQPPGSVYSIPAAAMFPQRRLLGCVAGGNVPRRDIARIVELYLAGKLELDALVGARVPLEKVHDAVAIAESGAVARAVVVFD
ncbi:MAG: alcohol dehydrogenase [Actinomycetia bacterium]|nr:alcohol dehydrogenase [Actinomycetes bacterium]